MKLKHDELLSDFACFGFNCNLRPCTMAGVTKHGEDGSEMHPKLVAVVGWCRLTLAVPS